MRGPVRGVAIEAVIGASKGSVADRPGHLAQIWRQIMEWCRGFR
jgi:hypothetical protein